MENVISINNLTKHFGRIKAVDNLNLEIPEKSVFGILGPNGSGKTTTLGMILDVVNPTKGTYSWFNNYSQKENRQRIGSILESPSFYPYLSAVNNLKIIADIKNYSYDTIDTAIHTVGLSERRDDKYRTYSLGMKQRLALASALLGTPEVLVLDEPTNGLDPQGIADVRQIITRVAEEGKTVILASHLLDEVQKVCSHFGVLNKGKLIYSGRVDEVSKKEQWVEIAAPDMDKLKKAIDSYSGIDKSEREISYIKVLLNEGSEISDLSKYLSDKNVYLTHLLARQKNLEQQFLDILNSESND